MITRHIFPFSGFTEFTPVIPKLYWNVYSQEQRIHRICEMLDKLAAYADYLGEEAGISREDIEGLQREFEEFKAHGFEDYYLEQIEKWVRNNLDKLYNELVKQVYFGLTLEGRLIAYIPESWNDIVFDTGMNYDLDTYGRLILRMDVSDEHNVDQTPENNRGGII